MAPLNTSTFGVDDFIPPPFVNTGPIVDMHKTPRAGHSNNITFVIESGDGRDYLVGIVYISIIMVAIFILWSLTLITFKCAGPKRLGWLSGTPPKLPRMPKDCEHHELELKQEEEAVVKGNGIVSKKETDDTSDAVEKEHGATDQNDGEEQEEEEEPNKNSSTEKNDDGVEMVAGFGVSASQEDDLVDGIDGSLFQTAKTDLDDVARRQGDESATADCGEEQEPNKNSSTEKNDPGVEMVADFGVTASQDGNSENLQKDNDGSQQGQDALQEWHEEVHRIRRLYRNGRIVVIICCLGILVVSALYIRFGIYSLVQSLSDIDESLNRVNKVTTLGIKIIDDFIQESENVDDYTNEFFQNFTNFCPAIGDELQEECGDINDEEDLVFFIDNPACAALYIDEIVDALAKVYDEFSETLVVELENLGDDLYEIVEITEDLSDTVNKFNWAFIISAIFAGIYIFVVILLVIGVILAWKGRLTCMYRCLSRAFILPIFCSSLILMWIFASVFIIGSLASADWCYDSPDDAVLAILREIQDKFSSDFVLKLGAYYLTGCELENPIQSILKPAVAVLDIVHRLISIVSEADIQNVSEFCGVDAGPIVLAANVLDLNAHNIIFTINDVRELFFCENWNPIYTSIAHDAICYNGVTGLTWIYSSYFAIGVFSMVIVTTRFAALNMIEEESAPSNLSVGQEESNEEEESTPSTPSVAQEEPNVDEENAPSKPSVAQEEPNGDTMD